MSARIDRLAWLTPDLALLVGVFERDVASLGETREAMLGGARAEARSFEYIGPEGKKQLITLRTPRRHLPGAKLGSLSLGLSGGDTLFEPAELGDASIDLQTILRTDLAPLPSASRAEILEFLAATPTAHPSAAGTPLTRTLVGIRDALRERLPTCVVGRDEAIGLAIECVLAIDEHRFFVQGWFRDAEAPVTSLRVVSPVGASVELLDLIYKFQRPDLERLYGVAPGDPRAGTGFACCFDMAAHCNVAHGWILELRNSEGSAVEAAGPRVVTSPNEVRNMLLGDIGLERQGEEALTRDHLFPAISRLQERNSQRLQVDRVVQFGDAPNDPDVSIIVPLYRRIDFLEHQLAQFSLDPEILKADLIYVLDSPELSRDLITLASQIFDLYRVPFRVATLVESNGYAGANRAGESLAIGRLLLFLNSDVLPESRGWLGRMVSFYDATPRIGVLGPKLLFEDDSIQHAGMFFRRLPSSPLWMNEHYFKGLHRDFAAAKVSRVVPAVTAACMLVDRALYADVGGFRSTFVRGDFEDSDLCLRLREIGRESWYLADVVLYHLEGQSYESNLRLHAWRYNAWLHTHLWGDLIDDLMREFGPERAFKASRPSVMIVPTETMDGDVVEQVQG